MTVYVHKCKCVLPVCLCVCVRDRACLKKAREEDAYEQLTGVHRPGHTESVSCVLYLVFFLVGVEEQSELC